MKTTEFTKEIRTSIEVLDAQIADAEEVRRLTQKVLKKLREKRRAQESWLVESLTEWADSARNPAPF